MLNTEEKDRKQEIEREKLKPKITTLDETPLWLRDNEFLQTGYRVNYYKKRDILKSLFQAHNETLNIWTHLIGALLFIWFIV